MTNLAFPVRQRMSNRERLEPPSFPLGNVDEGMLPPKYVALFYVPASIERFVPFGYGGSKEYPCRKGSPWREFLPKAMLFSYASFFQVFDYFKFQNFQRFLVHECFTIIFAHYFLCIFNSPHVSPFSLISGSLSMKHPNLFGRREMLDIGWHKGLHDSNFMIAYRKTRPPHLGQRSMTLQHSVSPEVGIHGIPMNNFSHSANGDVNLSQLSIGLDMSEPSISSWRNTTSISFKHIRFTNNGGRSISRDLDGFPVTRSDSSFDNMMVIKQESRFEEANDERFSHYSLQMEQGVSFLSNTTFNRFKFVVSKGVKFGPAFFSTWLTGGSIVGAIAPYQAFAIGGPGSVRGYGEGSVGSGQSCLVSNSELTIPLKNTLEGVVFLDCGSDLGTSHRVPGNPALRKGKPGSGFGIGYGVRFKSQLAHVQVDYAINAFQQRTVYFGIINPAL